MCAGELAAAERDVLEGLARSDREWFGVWYEVALLRCELESVRVVTEGQEAQAVTGVGVHDQHGKLDE